VNVKVRPAGAEDKGPLMSFIKDVWGGHDYIPEVWDEWLTDPKGKMFVVEADGLPVGMNRLRFLQDGSAWVEGVRVHPAYRGKGLASMLGDNSIKLAKEKGVNVFRLTSGSHNKAAHRQIARIKFDELARFSAYEPPENLPLIPTNDAAQASIEDFRRVKGLIQRTKEFQLGKGVYWHEWTATSLSPKVIRELMEEGAIWLKGDAVAVVREGREGEQKSEEIGFVGGREDDAWRLLNSILGRNVSASERWVFLPQMSPLIHRLREEGFVRNFSLVLFERRAPNG
jgi:GNAT superfamily N-acetyltransferase